MLLVALLLGQSSGLLLSGYQPVSPVLQSAVPEQEVIVTARRLETWRGQISGPSMKCRTLRSTGDKALDRVGCDAMKVCQHSTQAAMPLPVGSRRLPPADVQEFYRRMSICVRMERSARIRTLLAQRTR